MKEENQLCAMEKELEQLRSLIGNVAHDLKTPLQSISMDFEVLRAALLAKEEALSARGVPKNGVRGGGGGGGRGDGGGNDGVVCDVNKPTPLVQGQQYIGSGKGASTLKMTSTSTSLSTATSTSTKNNEGGSNKDGRKRSNSGALSPFSTFTFTSTSTSTNEVLHVIDEVVEGEAARTNADECAADTDNAQKALSSYSSSSLNSLILSPQDIDTARISSRRNSGNLDPFVILDSLSATSNFMSMAINRCLDFTKVSTE
jgi:hypothetical protein